MKVDLIVIGGGPGGYEAAVYAASKGLKVALFEERRLGGTCLNRGCIPTKTLCHEADILLQRPSVDGHVDYAALLHRRDDVVAQLVAGVETLMQTPGLTYVPRHASLRDAHTVEAEGEEYTADYVIVAMGSVPMRLPIEGIEYAITSDELLTGSDALPKRLCIVGGGVIGMEMASAYAAFGSEVTVVEFLHECLPTVDADIAKRLRRKLSERGIAFQLNAKVTSILPDRTVCFSQKGKSLTVEADAVLMATGRQANFGGLDLDALGIAYTRRGITVDKDMRTSLDGVYAIGDVNGRMMLAHAAKYQGFHAVNHLLGHEDGIQLALIPSAVFTNPEVASVGMTEQNLKESGLICKVRKSFYRANGKALSMGETDGMVKMLLLDDGRIVGCHVMGAHAADLVQEVTVAMHANMTFGQLQEVVHIHPTLAEVLVS